MIRKEMKLIITFSTTTEAMAMEQTCEGEGVNGRLIPVPKAITAGCGLAWCAPLECEEALRELMKRNSIQPEGIQQCLI